MENENKYYVYIHTYPGTDEPFYVGKGHGNRAYVTNRSKWWKNIVNKYNGFDVKFIYENLSDDEALNLEKEIIAKLGRRDKKTGCLINLTDGGDGRGGAIVSKETREKLAANWKGRKHTEESKQKMSDAASGKPKSEEHRKKISEVQTGRKLSDEHRQHISEGNKGVIHKDRGTPMSEEHKVTISNALKGRTPSEEHKAKLAEASRLNWARRRGEI